MLAITAVTPGSIAEELDLECGDLLITINGAVIDDQIDYQLSAQGEEFVFNIQKINGELWELEFERDEDDPIGLEFSDPQPRQCANNCQFCFVRQLPTGLRDSLYVRDDDYRFSYLYGAYISLTNLAEADIERIITQKLTPLYVSVHSSDDAKRSELLGRPVPEIMPILQRLIAGGIQLHSQIVLCPDLNDGSWLAQTVSDLAMLYPGILSLAVVPVGLTKYRQRLPSLRCFTAAEARAVIEQINTYQHEFWQKLHTRFVFPADEFYLNAAMDFPALRDYEELQLLENGVGLIPLFRHETQEMLLEVGCYSGIEATIVTGVSAHMELERFCSKFNDQTEARLRVQVVKNDFFGHSVTVAGLLVGADIVHQLSGIDLGRFLLIPDVMCREGAEVFLDDMSLEQLADSLQVEVVKIPATPWGIMEFIDFIATHTGHNSTWL